MTLTNYLMVIGLGLSDIFLLCCVFFVCLKFRSNHNMINKLYSDLIEYVKAQNKAVERLNTHFEDILNRLKSIEGSND